MSETPVTDQLERIALCRAVSWPNALREMEKQNATLSAELARVTAERDAALKDAERVRVAVFEFINDWRKGDFDLPELAQCDVRSIIDTYAAIDAAREG